MGCSRAEFATFHDALIIADKFPQTMINWALLVSSKKKQQKNQKKTTKPHYSL